MIRCSRLLLLLAALATTALAAEIEGLPSPATPRSMTFASPVETTLENGLRVIVVDRPATPLLSAGLLVRAGAESDPAALPGLAQFSAGLLQRGTTSRTAPEIAQDLEELGASLVVEATWDATMAELATLAPNAPTAFAIMADVICHPKFDSEELERLRKERIDEVQVALEQPGQVARAVAARAIFGSTPYGHLVSGTPASLARITAPDITAHYHAHFRPDNAVLVIVGDIRNDAAIALARHAFGEWKGSGSPATKDPTQPASPSPRAILIDDPEAGQAAVYVGTAQTPRSIDAAYYTGQVTNAILGGGYSARLNREVRIRRGLSYGCGSKLTAWRSAGLFASSCQTKNPSVAEVVQVIRGELSRLGSEPVEADELKARRLVLTGSFQRELETNAGYLRRILDFVLYGQAPDVFVQSLEGFAAVTPAEIQRFAQTHFNPEKMTVVVVGRAADCEGELRKMFPSLHVIPRAALDLDHASPQEN